MRPIWITSLVLAVVSLPAWAAIPPQPGVLNYVEGQASIGSQPLDSKSVGAAQLRAGQSLQTTKGKAEILLTPGVYLRVSDDSSVRMISPALENTVVKLQRGHAMVEVDQIFNTNNLQVMEDGATTRLLKKGLYGFDARAGQVRVFEGQAVVTEGNRQVKLKGGRELTLNGPLKAQKFDKKAYYTGLYGFSNLRSAYLAEANQNAAQTYVVNTGGWHGPGWYGPGWWWDPWFGGYTFFPADGYLFSPFGFGFFSPVFVSGGHFRHFDRDDFAHGRVFTGVRPGFAGAQPRVFAGGARPGGGFHPMGGFHGAGGGFHGGGFHGGMHR